MTDRFAAVLRGEGIGPHLAGGKGAALDRLIALKARVPPTGVVTTSAYRAFAAAPDISPFLDELRSARVPDPREHVNARKRVDEAFLSVPLPGEVAEAVDEMAVDIGNGGAVAVRSSATAEDLASASFAGQYESYLSIRQADLHDAVRRVWSSLWYPAPCEYRRFRGIPEDDLTMAVVVMLMLDPTEAGVVFTVDPAGNRDAMRLEVVQGLGEKLVSGQETPDAHVVPRNEAAEHFARISPALGDLAREALRLEEEFQTPQDIEFAVHRGDVYIVQARPITVLSDGAADDGFDSSPAEGATYTTAGIAEMLPGVLPPLSWTLNSWLVEGGFRHLFETLGGSAEQLVEGHELIGRFRGRAALNLDAMRVAASSVPGGSADELERQYFGKAVPQGAAGAEPTGSPLSKGAGALQGVRVLRARRDAAEQSEVVVRAVRGVLDKEPDLADLSDRDLLAYWNRLLHLSQQVVATEILVAAIAAAAYRGVEVFLGRYLSHSEAATAAQRLTQKDAHQRRARIALALEPVIERIQDDPALAATAVEDWGQASAKLRSTPRGSDLLEEFAALLTRAGSTAVFAGPTWDEVPQLAWMTVYQELAKPSSGDAADSRTASRVELEELLTREPRWRWARFVTGQLMDVRRRFLRREAIDAAEFLQRRERTKAAVLILGGVVRRANLEIGRRMVRSGVLEVPEDVEMLSASEIPAFARAAAPTAQVIARRRRAVMADEQAGPLPMVWTGEPEQAATPAASGERLEGWSASPGRFEGVARVVDAVAASTLRRGEVLVARTTDASWAPLFMAAGAVIVEQGGPLSHAAIVARELGMPAVVNVPGIVDRLRDQSGAVSLSVDGTTGTVTLLPRGLADADAPHPDESDDAREPRSLATGP